MKTLIQRFSAEELILLIVAIAIGISMFSATMWFKSDAIGLEMNTRGERICPKCHRKVDDMFYCKNCGRL